MMKTPKGLRLHIGLFGRRNVGKSSILNALVDQQVSIVSDIAGTTTDPVEKVMELKPIGPVVFIDTAGVDDEGALGQRRIDKTLRAVDRTEVALLVTDQWLAYEQTLVDLFRERGIPVVVVANKQDLRRDDTLERQARSAGMRHVVGTSAVKGTGIDALRETVIEVTPQDFITEPPLIRDLVCPGDHVILVTPIDLEAPKGRLKMLQVHCLREILDAGALASMVKETELPQVLDRLTRAPDLVVSDSQVFDRVVECIGSEVPATTFSILMARFKGDFPTLLQGVEKIALLKPADRILIAEACTHHPVGEDIGRVQIPRLLCAHINGELQIDVCAGRDFPDDVSAYDLIIHCGACVFNPKEMIARIQRARDAGVPITNYGLALTCLNGHLERALSPFKAMTLLLHPDATRR